MNLEQRTRNAQTLSMVAADVQAVSKRLSRHFGDQDQRVRQLRRAADLIEGVRENLTGGTH